MLSESAIITRYFEPLAHKGEALCLKDDVALLSCPPDQDLIVSQDMLLANTHFFEDDDPAFIAAKAIRSNLSDILAKGADPMGYCLGLGLPKNVSTEWLEAFSSSLKHEQEQANIALLGGDTVFSHHGVMISITILGHCPKGQMVRRIGAKAGDGLYVTGKLGQQAFAYALYHDDAHALLPEDCKTYQADRSALPELPFGIQPLLRRYASASMDLSDGLHQDLNKLLSVNDVQAVVNIKNLPFAAPLSSPATPLLADCRKALQNLALGWGEDHQIMMAVPPENEADLIRAAQKHSFHLTRIGYLQQGQGIVYQDAYNQNVSVAPYCYSHF
jgi:thiamine-monophosphate kinase